jgi:UDP-N-acetylglucosamine 2-epimerase
MPLTIVSIVGARPEFVQAMPVSRALRTRHREVLVHTGQHYDHAMSDRFFSELDLPQPDVNLDVRSASHGRQTAAMLERIEDLLLARRPDAVLVRGDTNSTLAGALAACKLGIPVIHVEAGERSFEITQPEEINRVAVDHISSLHFCVSQAAVRRLAVEGLTNSVTWVGDVMLDALLMCVPVAARVSDVLARLGVTPGRYALATVHRAVNTDNPERLRAIVSAVNRVDERVVFPVHPRTRHTLKGLGLRFGPQVVVTDPVGYLDMLQLERHARLIATDSGGVQREAYYLGVPCLTLRDETEWRETVEAGWNTLVGTDPARVLAAWSNPRTPAARPPIYGTGQAADAIVRGIEAFMAGRRP